MWTCSHCDTQIEDQFDSCWNCGSSADGDVNPDLRASIAEERLRLLDEEPVVTQRRRWQFTIWRCLTLMTLLALLIVVVQTAPHWMPHFDKAVFSILVGFGFVVLAYLLRLTIEKPLPPDSADSETDRP